MKKLFGATIKCLRGGIIIYEKYIIAPSKEWRDKLTLDFIKDNYDKYDKFRFTEREVQNDL